MTRSLRCLFLCVLSLPFSVACSSDPLTSNPAPPPARGPAASASASASAAVPLPKVEFHEEDFAEGDRSRDPFRSFARLFAEQSKTRIKSQRQVLLDQYAVDELRLVGLVTRTQDAKAMLVDPTGKGWVVTKGQFIGRSEIIRGGGQGSVDYELNWKVDRIRDGDVVLIREDPAHSDVPVSTRVISLRADSEGKIR